ncbi:TetR/AcrR family transcriptional regulator [Salibacterium halotolerans]|uniref:Regulatory protein, tetR family n=1 Tax=Salibacterium halotolerans TaxID=1884432 RepID=A0A1I5M1Y4_9BACI|nr:TetR/AcrR family transcriptional regulator [Salibacterium halotolerans]SFP03051.1 regulatory protein, tetR family [Salibacterium halotolerans]
MKNKEIQMQRMWQYFVDATVEIIDQKGIENVTIREIADKAGYNSATIYNYFQEVSHLIFFAALKYLNNFIEDLPAYIEKSDNSIDRYLLSWKCFCEHSFENPDVFHAIFLADLGDGPEEFLTYYYRIYQSDIFDDFTEDLETLIVEYNLSTRSRKELDKSVQQGYLTNDTAAVINERTVLIWQGMLATIINNRRYLNTEEATNKTMQHITEIVNSYRLDNPGFLKDK